MMKNDLKNKVNNKYIELWKDYENKIELETFPSLYPELKNDCLLFVGINPSCANRKKRVAEVEGKYVDKLTDEDVEEFFKWDSEKIDEKREKIIKERKIPRGAYDNLKKEEKCGPYRYFKEFYKISNSVLNNQKENDVYKYEEREWEHIDVFRTIAKNQDILKDKLKIENDGKDMNEFAVDQYDIFRYLLEKICPKVVIVQNSLARKIIRNREKINRNVLEEKGFETITLNGKNIPIFFTGMLSMGYDIGSKERLIWHIKKAKEWVEK